MRMKIRLTKAAFVKMAIILAQDIDEQGVQIPLSVLLLYMLKTNRYNIHKKTLNSNLYIDSK